MNHFQQPGGVHPDFLSGPTAIHHVVQRMYGLGCRREQMHALLFGGAQVIDAFVGVNDIGADNLAVAETVLEDIGIPIVHRHTGGARARKLFFRTDTGGHAVKLLAGRVPNDRHRSARPAEAEGE